VCGVAWCGVVACVWERMVVRCGEWCDVCESVRARVPIMRTTSRTTSSSAAPAMRQEGEAWCGVWCGVDGVVCGVAWCGVVACVWERMVVRCGEWCGVRESARVSLPINGLEDHISSAAPAMRRGVRWCGVVWRGVVWWMCVGA